MPHPDLAFGCVCLNFSARKLAWARGFKVQMTWFSVPTLGIARKPTGDLVLSRELPLAINGLPADQLSVCTFRVPPHLN